MLKKISAVDMMVCVGIPSFVFGMMVMVWYEWFLLISGVASIVCWGSAAYLEYWSCGGVDDD